MAKTCCFLQFIRGLRPLTNIAPLVFQAVRQCEGEGGRRVTWTWFYATSLRGERLVYLLFIFHLCLDYLLFVSKVYNCFSFHRYHHISSALSFMWSTPTGSPPLFQKHCESSGEKRTKQNTKQHKQRTPVFVRFLRLEDGGSGTGSTPLVLIPDIMHRNTRLLRPLWCERS